MVEKSGKKQADLVDWTGHKTVNTEYTPKSRLLTEQMCFIHTSSTNKETSIFFLFLKGIN